MRTWTKEYTMLLVIRLPRHRDLKSGHFPRPETKIVQSVSISNHLYIVVRCSFLLNWFEMAVGLSKDYINPGNSPGLKI